MLWPLVSDTNHFDYDAGLPPVERLPNRKEQQATARRELRFRLMGMTIEWEEEPFEWIRPQRFGITRRYLNGPVAEARARAEFIARPEGGTRLVYQVWARPRNVVGFLLIPFQVGWISARKFAATVRRYDQLAFQGKPFLELGGTARFAPGGRARLETLCKTLLVEGVASHLVTRLAETIKHADDLAVSRLRPYALADAWRSDRHEVLKLCLLATRLGLLDFRWDVLCPLCRGPKSTNTTLREVHAQVHCESCNIDFTANFDQSVELTFRPNASVRCLDIREFCVGGPQITPHIVAQQLLGSKEQRNLTLPLEEGRYRLRVLGFPGGPFFRSDADGQPKAVFRTSTKGWFQEEAHLNPTPMLQLENETDREQLFILERLAWSDQATTAAEVIALQIFRDLFANEALRPGEQISVGSMTILFTDLRHSTRLYREIGDAPAFGRVMKHFDLLREALVEEEGALVKTIGDAVKGVFRRPVSALQAVLKAQQRLAASSEPSLPLLLKVGIHHGPCIAVNLNERMDYFGSTVNIAARLVNLSSGEDIVISHAVYADPEVDEWFHRSGQTVRVEPAESTLRGFGDETFGIWRVRSG